MLWLCLLISLLSCKSSPSDQILNIGYDHPSIMYQGRIGVNPDKNASEIYWSGSSIKINFNIDLVKLKKGKHKYILAENLSNQKHFIELSKRNEWTYGTTLFHSFLLEGDILPADPDKKLFIEFYGDSITTGHGNEDTTGDDKPTGDVTNNYNTYAAMTARNFDAQYTCIARGGIGIMVSWFNMIMPEMYDLLNPNDTSSKWDFSKKQPDIVVINLFQNDSWIVNHPDHKEYKRRFGEQGPTTEKIVQSYKGFVEKIRTQYPNSKIVCLLGNMDITKEGSKWPSYVTSAITKLKDKNVFTCFIPFKNSKGHPSVTEHQIIAQKLSALIRKEILNK